MTRDIVGLSCFKKWLRQMARFRAFLSAIREKIVSALRKMESWWASKPIVFLLLIGNLVAWVVLFAPVTLFEYHFPENYDPDKYIDAVELALSIGRLDTISAMLAALAIFLAVVGLIGVGYFKEFVEKISKKAVDDRLARNVQDREDANIENASQESRVPQTSQVRPEEGENDV